MGTVWPTWKDVLEGDEEEEEIVEAVEGEAKEEPEEGDEIAATGEDDEDKGGSSSATPSVVKERTGKRLRLDLEVEASGFGRAMQRELEDVSWRIYIVGEEI